MINAYVWFIFSGLTHDKMDDTLKSIKYHERHLALAEHINGTQNTKITHLALAEHIIGTQNTKITHIFLVVFYEYVVFK